MKLDWLNSYSVERELAEILAKQEQHGWFFNLQEANRLVEWLRNEEVNLTNSILPNLPNTIQNQGTYKKIFNKDGSYSNYIISWVDSLDYDDDLPNAVRISTSDRIIEGLFTRVSIHPPNLASQDQLKKALDYLGWVPDTWNYKKDPKTKKNIRADSGDLIPTSPKITESSLDSISAKDGWGKDLIQLLKIQARLKFFGGDEEEKGLLQHVRSDGSVPSETIQCGTNTGRAQHIKVANVPRIGSFLGEETRSLFMARPGTVLVGTDYSQLESRVIAELIYRYTRHKYGKGDYRYADLILTSEDIHTYTLNALSDLISSRNKAKTITYALAFGAQESKLGSICDIRTISDNNKKLGSLVLDRLKESFPGLIETRDATVEQSKVGWVPGVDGRKIYVRSPHSAFNAKVQGIGSEIVKKGMVLKNRVYKENNIPVVQVSWYHDEWTDEALFGYEEDCRQISLQSVVESGEYYSFTVPMIGDSKIGDSWADIH
jgi:DNA polymerase I